MVVCVTESGAIRDTTSANHRRQHLPQTLKIHAQAMNHRWSGRGKASTTEVWQDDLQWYMDVINTKFLKMEGQLRAITQHLANLEARGLLWIQAKRIRMEAATKSPSLAKPTWWSPYAKEPWRLEDWGDDLNVKIEILEHQGSVCGDRFMEWNEVIEQIFEYQEIPNECKVKFVAMQLRARALAWWAQTKETRKRRVKHKLTTWERMKSLMCEAVLLVNYVQSLFQRLQHIP